MHLVPLFEKYLDLCNYEIETLSQGELADLDMPDEPLGPKAENVPYGDIPTLSQDDFDELTRSKKTGPLSDLEILSMYKHRFMLTFNEGNCADDVVSDMWKLYIDSGAGRFRNLSYEKGLIDGSVRVEDIIDFKMSVLASKMSQRLEIIRELTGVLGLGHSQEVKDFDVDMFAEEGPVSAWIAGNRERVCSVFEVRCAWKTLGNEGCVKLVNSVLGKWGFSSIKSLKTIRRIVNGKRTQTRTYKCVSNSAVYRNIYRKTVGQTNPRLMIERGCHLE
jgi:hypothetical protein